MRRIRPLLAVLVLVAVGLLQPVATTMASAAAPAWQAVNTLPMTMQSMMSLACPTSLVCEGLAQSAGAYQLPSIYPGLPTGLRLYRSTDGGATWTQQQVDVPDDASGVSCPDAERCFVASSPVLGTTDGGQHWEALPGSSLPEGATHRLTNMTCRSASFCVETGTDNSDASANVEVLSTSDGGSTWHYLKLGGLSTLDGLACTSDTHCIMTGIVQNSPSSFGTKAYETSDGWMTSSELIFPKDLVFSPVRCTAGGHCIAIAKPGTFVDAASFRSQVYLSDDGGTTWAKSKGALPKDVGSVIPFCDDATHCGALADVARVSPPGRDRAFFSSTDGGRHFKLSKGRIPMPEGPQSLTPVQACSSIQHCVAATDGSRGVELWSTADGGATWTQAGLGDGSLGVTYATSCPSSAACFVLMGYRVGAGVVPGVELVTVPSNGSLPSSVALKKATMGTALSCPTPKVCYALTDHATYRVPTHGGKPAVLSNVPRFGLGGHWPRAISCTDAMTCTEWIEGMPYRWDFPQSYALHTTDGGVTWTKSTSVRKAANTYGGSLSCSGPSTCVVFFGSGLVIWSADAGMTWKKSTLPSSTIGLGAVTCSSATTCRMVRDDTVLRPAGTTVGLLSSSDGGKTFTDWGAGADPGTGTWKPKHIACADDLHCSVDGTAFTEDGGQTWTQDASTPATLFSLHCPVAGTCLGLETAKAVGWRLWARS